VRAVLLIPHNQRFKIFSRPVRSNNPTLQPGVIDGRSVRGRRRPRRTPQRY